MNILIVAESYFGNTRLLADSMASSLQAQGHTTTIVEVNDAPTTIPEDVDVLVVGGPTHNRGMSTPKSRGLASGGKDPDRIGVREWLAKLSVPGDPRIAAYDTVTSTSWINGSAAKQMAKTLAAHAKGKSMAIKSFVVRSKEGPLDPAQIVEAESWANSLTR